jgi:hypothetical protein
LVLSRPLASYNDVIGYHKEQENSQKYRYAHKIQG